MCEPGLPGTPLGSVSRDFPCFNVVFFVRKSLNPSSAGKLPSYLTQCCCRCHCNVADSGSILNDKLCTRCRREAPALWNLLRRRVNYAEAVTSEPDLAEYSSAAFTERFCPEGLVEQKARGRLMKASPEEYELDWQAWRCEQRNSEVVPVRKYNTWSLAYRQGRDI